MEELTEEQTRKMCEIGAHVLNESFVEFEARAVECLIHEDPSGHSISEEEAAATANYFYAVAELCAGATRAFHCGLTKEEIHERVDSVVSAEMGGEATLLRDNGALEERIAIRRKILALENSVFGASEKQEE